MKKQKQVLHALFGPFSVLKKQNDILDLRFKIAYLFCLFMYKRIIDLILTIFKILISLLSWFPEYKILLQESYQINYRPIFNCSQPETIHCQASEEAG